MPKILTLAAFALVLGFSLPALAHGPGASHHQVGRIERGYARGDLTRMERHRLLRQQHRLARMQHRAYADGVVTPREARRLRAFERAARRQIAYERRDHQRRY